jgi:Max protein
MSDEGEIDVESDDVAEGMEGDDEVMGKNLDKRAHHNALERKRRDHIKDSFTNLRDCIPSLSGEKVCIDSNITVSCHFAVSRYHAPMY